MSNVLLFRRVENQSLLAKQTSAPMLHFTLPNVFLYLFFIFCKHLSGRNLGMSIQKPISKIHGNEKGPKWSIHVVSHIKKSDHCTIKMMYQVPTVINLQRVQPFSFADIIN